MKPNISFHLVFCFPYWLSYNRVYQEDNPILQGAGVQQLRGLFCLWLQLIFKLLCDKVQETASCGWMYLHICCIYNPMSAQCSEQSDLTGRKSAQVPNQIKSVQYFSWLFPVVWSGTSGGIGLHPHHFPQCFLSICSCISSLSGQQVRDTSAPQTSCKKQRHSQFLDPTPEVWLLNVKHCSTLLLGS